MDGTINIIPETIQAGEEVEIQLQSPPDTPFIAQIRIAATPSMAIVDQIATININPVQSSVAIGEPFTVTFDSLNFPSGLFYFGIFAPGKEAIYDSLTITSMDPVPLSLVRTDMAAQNRLFGLYNETGQFFTEVGTSDPPPALSPGTVYALAVNLNQLHNFSNIVHVDLFDPSGTQLQKADLMKIKIVRDKDMNAALKAQGTCNGELVNPQDEPDGIAVIHFKTPKHLKYYEYDGQLKFRFDANTNGNASCILSPVTLLADLDDSPAAAPIPDFQTYNDQKYPGQSWRDNYPFDTHHVRLVRFGQVRINTTTALQNFANYFEQEFSKATKGYFKLVVDGTHQFDLVQSLNQSKVADWYQSVPKTPGKPILDLTDPNQLYLATLLYYYEHPETEFVNDMKSLYPMGSNDEEFTVYLFDGPGSLGNAMGANGNRIKVTRLYPGYVFYEGTGSNRTYHFDLDSCSVCGDSPGEYLQYMSDGGSDIQTLNTAIHEMGHVAWIKKAGVSTGDLSTQKFPFASDLVYEDDSIGYFTRFEYMSYGRDRSSLANMSYGDEYLEKVLDAYAQPTAWVSITPKLSFKESLLIVMRKFFGWYTPKADPNTVTIQAGKSVKLKLHGKANSGLRMLWYFNQSGPEVFDYGTKERFGVFIYPVDGPRVRVDEKAATLTFNTPGTYIYKFRSRDRLYPITWQSHQSKVGEFTIIVEP